MVRLLALLLATSAMAPRAAQAEPFSGDALKEFLGPVPSEIIDWEKQPAIDFELYNGVARAPLSGKVGFYLGTAPNFKPPSNSTVVKAG